MVNFNFLQKKCKAHGDFTEASLIFLYIGVSRVLIGKTTITFII
jgi:hypothetical protein